MLRKNYMMQINEDELHSLCNLLLTVKVFNSEPALAQEDLTEMDRRVGRELLAVLCRETGR